MSKPRPLSPGAIAKYIREVAAEVHTVDDDMNPVNKGEALARLLWDKALGHYAKDPKTGEKVWHPPQKEAQFAILDRHDGKVGTAGDDTTSKFDTTRRVSELTKDLLNSLTAKVTSSGDSAPPPPPAPRKDSDDE